MKEIAFTSINWDEVPTEKMPGSSGYSRIKTKMFGGLRIRLIEYSALYLADHWCQKGHVVHCLEGSVETQMEDGSSVQLNKGMSYVVSDGRSSHRSWSKDGATLLIMDGEFLKLGQ